MWEVKEPMTSGTCTVEYRLALYWDESGFQWYEKPERPISYLLCSHKTNLIWASNDRGPKPGRMASTAFFCPVCADTWGWKTYVLPPHWPRSETQVLTRKCPYHGGGSLVFDWTKYRPGLADQLPIELLKWELMHYHDHQRS